jgi:D-glycero-alpha-D-manno-heptose 1-phosphate guanylyltransferase
MEAIILCGGLGTRLREALPDRPKCLAPIGNKTYLDIFTDFLFHQGVSRVVFATGHMAHQVEDWVRSTPRPWQWAFSRESSPMGTGGALRLACEHVEAPHFLAFNGDTFLDLRCRPFMDFHLQHGADVTLSAVSVTDTLAYGRVELKDGFVSSFLEKGVPGAGLINGGAYAIRSAFLQSLPQQAFSFENDVLMKPGVRPAAYLTEGRFLDIGTPENLALAENFVSAMIEKPRS